MGKQIQGNVAYLALAPEVTPGVAVRPTRFVPLYSDNLKTNLNLNEIKAAFGHKFNRLMVLPGQRAHGGSFTVMAEPNSAHAFYDMLLTRGDVTGTDPYTWPFTPSMDAPKTYTIDVFDGVKVNRYAGFEASEVKPTLESNEWRLQVSGAALKAFIGAEVESVDGAVVTLKTLNDDPRPSAGLVAGDTVALIKASDDSRQAFTISSLTSTTVTLSGSPSGISAGDMLVIDAATPDLDILTPFMWARTEFRFGDTAAAALTATHTPVEIGSELTHTHSFEDDEGAKSSGSFDPSALARTDVDSTITIKKFHEDADDAREFKRIAKKALVIRMFSGSSHELRYTYNNVRRRDGGDRPAIEVAGILYNEFELVPVYDQGDGAAYKVEVINGVAEA